jgi:hypothetical protein
LCAGILSLAAEVAPGSDWVVLAADPDIASLPWNLLARQCDETKGQSKLISVVPSLGWVTTEARPHWRREDGVEEPCTGLFLSDESNLLGRLEGQSRKDLGDLLFRMQQDEARLKQTRWSAAFILGHGALDAAREYYTVIAPDKRLDINEWIEGIGRFRIVVLHACLCGQVRSQFVGDLSGIPGMLLMRETRLCCSPVVEVFPRTAIRLQEYVVDGKTTSPTVLDRYRDALSDDPTVGFYNLYGLDSGTIRLPQA